MPGSSNAPLHAALILWIAGCGGLFSSSSQRVSVDGAAGGGAGGIGGVGGGGDLTGAGGSRSIPPTCPQTPPTFCNDANLCGNGVRDACAPYTDECGARVVLNEACDGDDVGGDCTRLGWGSGPLSCNASCYLVEDACSECVPDPRVGSCGDAPVALDGLNARIAATAAEVAVGWQEIQATGSYRYYLARLSPTLQPLSETELVPSGTPARLVPLAVAPLGSGWAAALLLEGGIDVWLVDSTGAEVARSTIPGIGAQVTQEPQLIPRSNGGPLVLWEESSAVRASVLSDDGRSASTPQDVLPIEGAIGFTGYLSATFANGGFYVLYAFHDAITRTPTNRLIRVETDGTPGPAIEVLPGVGDGTTTLVAGAGDLRVTYWSPTPLGAPTIVHWQKIDFDGRLLSPPVSLTTDPSVYPPALLALDMDGDTVVLLESGGLPGTISLERLDPAGTVVTPTFPVLAWGTTIPNPYLGFFGPAARRGPEIVLAWSAARMARVTPSP